MKRVGSGSVSQRCGSGPYQIVTDPEHCFLVTTLGHLETNVVTSKNALRHQILQSVILTLSLTSRYCNIWMLLFGICIGTGTELSIRMLPSDFQKPYWHPDISSWHPATACRYPDVAHLYLDNCSSVPVSG
jgi:hypothetical protein